MTATAASRLQRWLPLARSVIVPSRAPSHSGDDADPDAGGADIDASAAPAAASTDWYGHSAARPSEQTWGPRAGMMKRW